MACLRDALAQTLTHGYANHIQRLMVTGLFALMLGMSPHCDGCRYDPAQRTGDTACPFTALHWDFPMRHQSLLAANPRMGRGAGRARLPDRPPARAQLTRPGRLPAPAVPAATGTRCTGSGTRRAWR